MKRLILNRILEIKIHIANTEVELLSNVKKYQKVHEKWFLEKYLVYNRPKECWLKPSQTLGGQQMHSVMRNREVKPQTDLRVNQIYYMDKKRRDFELHDTYKVFLIGVGVSISNK